MVTTNILFGGMELKKHNDQTDVKDWLLAHFMLLIAKSEKFIRRRLESNTENIVQELINNFTPDLLIINEVMPDVSNQVNATLQKHGYNFVIEKATYRHYPLSVATVIASKFEGTKFQFTLPGNAGGGSCGFFIPKLDTIILAPHPSAFNKKIRSIQIEHIIKVIEDIWKQNPDKNIVLAGDFNAKSNELDPHFKPLPFKHFSGPSFPNDSIYQQLNKLQWRWLKSIMELKNGQRDIDHIYIPESWNTSELKVHQTQSDHAALVLKFRR